MSILRYAPYGSPDGSDVRASLYGALAELAHEPAGEEKEPIRKDINIKETLFRYRGGIFLGEAHKCALGPTADGAGDIRLRRRSAGREADKAGRDWEFITRRAKTREIHGGRKFFAPSGEPG